MSQDSKTRTEVTLTTVDTAQPTASEPALQPIQNHDLTTCCHRHQILASATEADPGSAVPVTLYHWCHPTACAKMTAALPPDALHAIKGFASLGTFFLPGDFDISKTPPELLTATATATAPAPSPEPTAQLLADLIAQLAVPEQGDFVRFFSFSVFSDSSTEIFGDGLRPVFKWAKPDGVYRKSGFWEAELLTAVEDGEWTGGKDLILLVNGVSEDTLQIIRAGEWKFTRLERVQSMISGGMLTGGG